MQSTWVRASGNRVPMFGHGTGGRGPLRPATKAQQLIGLFVYPWRQKTTHAGLLIEPSMQVTTGTGRVRAAIDIASWWVGLHWCIFPAGYVPFRPVSCGSRHCFRYVEYNIIAANL